MAYAPDNAHWIQCPAATVVLKDLTNAITYTMPTISFGYEVGKGNDVVKLLDGSSAASNIIAGVATGRFQLALGMVPGVTTAAWFNNAYILNPVITTANYYTLTVYRFPADAAPLTFQFCKFDTWRLRAMWDLNGANQMVMMNTTGWSADPLDGTALTLTSPGPIGDLKSFAQSTFTGATQVTQLDIAISRSDVAIPAVLSTGGNANLPYLSGGIIQGQLMGGVELKQSALAATVPGVNNAEAAFTAAFGGTGDGISFAMTMENVYNGGNVDQGIAYQVSRYKLVSSDGTNAGMITASDL